jgi:hypothetical protein
MKLTNRWKVSYMMKGTAYQEHVDIGADLSYLIAAGVAMDKVRDANDNKLTDMSAQQMD